MPRLVFDPDKPQPKNSERRSALPSSARSAAAHSADVGLSTSANNINDNATNMSIDSRPSREAIVEAHAPPRGDAGAHGKTTANTTSTVVKHAEKTPSPTNSNNSHGVGNVGSPPSPRRHVPVLGSPLRPMHQTVLPFGTPTGCTPESVKVAGNDGGTARKKLELGTATTTTSNTTNEGDQGNQDGNLSSQTNNFFKSSSTTEMKNATTTENHEEKVSESSLKENASQPSGENTGEDVCSSRMSSNNSNSSATSGASTVQSESLVSNHSTTSGAGEKGASVASTESRSANYGGAVEAMKADDSNIFNGVARLPKINNNDNEQDPKPNAATLAREYILKTPAKCGGREEPGETSILAEIASSNGTSPKFKTPEDERGDNSNTSNSPTTTNNNAVADARNADDAAHYEEDLARALQESQKQFEAEENKRKRKHHEASLKTAVDEDGKEVILLTDSSSDNGSEENYKAQLDRAMALSLEEKNRENWEEVPVVDVDTFDDQVHSIMELKGGLDDVEKGAAVTEGNNDMKKKFAVCGGGNQIRAQYGRVTVEGFKRIIDKLEGTCPPPDDTPSKEDDDNTDDSKMKSDVGNADDAKKKNKDEVNDSKEGKDDSDLRDPEPRKIKAMIDIGHGLGIQVLQAGLCLGIPSRGVELMKKRHELALFIRDNMRDGPFSYCDFSKIQLELCDFTHAFLPRKSGDEHLPKFTEYDELKRNLSLRKWLMFNDLTEDEQEHAVIYANNFGEVFGSRAKKGDLPPLDQHLAEMFANMKVGGRIVTLNDLSPHFGRKDWFRRDVFESGDHTVSWSLHKSIRVYCLTKLADEWTCANVKCGFHNPIVNKNGRLHEDCFCGSVVKNTRNKKRRS